MLSADSPENPHENAKEPPDELLGKVVGPYRIVRRIGAGGMGVVYEARHESIGQRVAIKVLHAELARDQKTLQRFFNEARAVSIAQHAGLVKIFDFGQLPYGLAYLLMEYLEGESLAGRLDRLQQTGQVLGLQAVLRLGQEIAAVLELTHQKGIVHRDLKPENVFLIPDPATPSGERAKLLDFGAAKFLEAPGRKTTTGVILGTPAYMAPELCEGRADLDDKVDVYALGVMLFEMLAGKPPFAGETTMALMSQHMFQKPPALGDLAPSVPGELRELVHQMMAKDRKKRPPMTQVRRWLAEVPPVPRRPRRRRSRALVAAAVLLPLLGAGALHLLVRRSPAVPGKDAGLHPRVPAVPGTPGTQGPKGPEGQTPPRTAPAPADPGEQAPPPKTDTEPRRHRRPAGHGPQKVDPRHRRGDEEGGNEVWRD